jgi:alanyl-tRNA synthetase
VAAGIRRVEAVTGWNAVSHFREEEAVLERVGSMTRSGTLRDVEARIQSMLDENERLKRELQRARAQLLDQSSGDVLDRVVEVDGVPFLAVELPVDSVPALREAADKLRDRMKRGVGLLAARTGDKAALCVFVTDDLVTERGIRADALVKEVAKVVDGGGGGRPQLATAGGKNPARIPDALEAAPDALGRLLAESASA